MVLDGQMLAGAPIGFTAQGLHRDGPCVSAECGYVLVYLVHDKDIQQRMDQPGKVANPARGRLNRKKNVFSLFLLAPENLVWRDRFGRSVPRHLVHSPHSR